MNDPKMLQYLQDVLENMPAGWLQMTTHRLDIFDEHLAKTQFLTRFEALYNSNDATAASLYALPTAYDYIRLGHPLSCILEWAIGKQNGVAANEVISFSSRTAPVLAILRKNLLDQRNTQILYTDALPTCFDPEVLRSVYGYNFELRQVAATDILPFDGSTIFVADVAEIGNYNLLPNIDFFVGIHAHLGAVIIVNGEKNANYTSEIQHVRRRETIAMTPANCLIALQSLIGQSAESICEAEKETNKIAVLELLKDITNTIATPLLASSGLSIQYAIMMGLVHDANINHHGKNIKFIVPPNCYGGTNDQARRVAACLPNVAIIDLPVDGENNMVRSIDTVLSAIALEDAVPYIIAEIPTNPRVEVPNLTALEATLAQERKTANGSLAIAPVFILDQTFCPNVHFLGQGNILASVRSIAYASGSKFPSGGQCTAGFVVASEKAANLMPRIAQHLLLCDNEATAHQYQILATQLPSMNQRIAYAYRNTRDFVSYIHEVLPAAKINFVSEELAAQGFTPSVFSLDLPTTGATPEERETNKRKLNDRLINMMITAIPTESKYCVSYGQLRGCYWTIPATSTQGTTKEGDKDYIARVALSANMDLEKHKQVFTDFVKSI